MGFTVLAIVMGVDKFFDVLVHWEGYLAPWIARLSPLSATGTMRVVGVVEIVAGVFVGLKPRYGAYVVAAWLGGIIVDPRPAGEQVRPAGRGLGGVGHESASRTVRPAGTGSDATR